MALKNKSKGLLILVGSILFGFFGAGSVPMISVLKAPGNEKLAGGVFIVILLAALAGLVCGVKFLMRRD